MSTSEIDATSTPLADADVQPPTEVQPPTDVQVTIESQPQTVESVFVEEPVAVESDEEALEPLPSYDFIVVDPTTGTVTRKPYENKNRKGTLPWILEEQETASKALAEIQEEFELNRNLLKLHIAILRSAREMTAEKEAELAQYEEVKGSLTPWIEQHQETYAWKLLTALAQERDKMDAFEQEVRTWVNSSSEKLREQAKTNKKKFVRRLRRGFIGVFVALGIGALVNLLLRRFGIEWIPRLLAFIGFTNPLTWIPKYIGIASVLTWIYSLFAYFRSYLNWRGQLNRHAEDARYYLRAVKELALERARLTALHAQMKDYLALLGEIIHNPWRIRDEWLNPPVEQLSTAALPTSLGIATPLESKAYAAVRKRALEDFASRNWRAQQVYSLFEEFEKANSMAEGSLADLFDSNPNLRAHMMASLAEGEVLAKVGDSFVRAFSRELQEDVLPNETGFHVASIKPEVLEGLDLSTELLDEDEYLRDWQAFVTEILGQATGWSPLVYSTEGRMDDLEKRQTIRSFAFVPERLLHAVDRSVEAVEAPKLATSGVEVVVRVDVSQWVQPEKVQLLDGGNSGAAVPQRQRTTDSDHDDIVRG